MGKIKWIDTQLKKYHIANSLVEFLVCVLLSAGGTIALAHYLDWWPYLLGGILGFFFVYSLSDWLSQKPGIAKSTHAKAFVSNFKFILLVCNLGLVVCGLVLAVWGIQITAEGNITTGGHVMTPIVTPSTFNTLANGYIHVLEVLAGVFVAAVILLISQFVHGLRKGNIETAIEGKPAKTGSISASNKPISLDCKTSDILQMKHEQLKTMNLMLKVIEKQQKQRAKVEQANSQTVTLDDTEKEAEP
jgi:hypothetical protein